MRVPRFPALPARSSLRGRLALWYLLVLGLVFALFGAGIYLEVRQSQLNGVDQVLQARALNVASQIHIGTNGVDYQGVDAPRANSEIAVYLFTLQGSLQDQIAGASSLPPQPSVLGPALQGHAGWATVCGLRLYMMPVPSVNDQGQGHVAGVVQVVESLNAVNTQLARLLALLLLATPALLLVATAGGIFLAGRALRPIDRITSTAGAIGAGNLTGRLGPMPGADEVTRLATTFDAMLDRLERAFAQQRQFAADASHELRTPLTIIKGDLDVLLRRRRKPEEYEEVARGADEEVTRLARLVDDLLTLARADSGQAQIATEFVYLDALVEDVVAGLRRLAETANLSLETNLQRDVAVLGDPDRLRQLVINLVSNAIKYTLAGGRVTVTLESVDGWARLEVADTGIGIASEDLPHIFDRFFRADKARAGNESGTGLGLSISRWAAEAHGGRISVQSRLGEGSVFTVLLPLILD
ncbi:MAG: cztS [Chloroflexi bacterium]|nr:cztS [Chloroflexota bacterium]